LRKANHEITSDQAPEYNCIAHAADDNSRFWWPGPGMNGYWPPGVPREVTIEAFIEAYKTIGYETTADETLEVGFDKIAIYVDKGAPTHAAKQLAEGQWSSKLGKNYDISHKRDAVSGGLYGEIAVYMKRKI